MYLIDLFCTMLCYVVKCSVMLYNVVWGLPICGVWLRSGLHYEFGGGGRDSGGGGCSAW
jgi:uncharacterized membrane protein YgcG